MPSSNPKPRSRSNSSSNSNSSRPASTRPGRKTSKRSAPTSRRTSQRIIKRPDVLNEQNIQIKKDTTRRIPKVILKVSRFRPINNKYIEIKNQEGVDLLSDVASRWPRAEEIQEKINSHIKKDTKQDDSIALENFIKFLTTKWKAAQLNNYHGLSVQDRRFPIKEEYILKYLIYESYSVPYARTILRNYTTLLRNENIFESTKEKNNIGSKITEDCKENFIGDEDKFCFCCGKPIKTKNNDTVSPVEVQCDHVIPVNTMLVTVTNDTVRKDLVFIHSTCNNKKGEMNIWDTYKQLGRKRGIFGNMVGTITDEEEKKNIIKCQDKFISILTSMKLRSIDDIKIRQSAMEKLNKKLHDDFIDFFNLYMNDGKTANNLVKLKNRIKLKKSRKMRVIPVVPRSRSRSRLRSRSRSRSRSKSLSSSSTSSSS